jgi:outer membrane protein, heavy metal efflux system
MIPRFERATLIEHAARARAAVIAALLLAAMPGAPVPLTAQTTVPARLTLVDAVGLARTRHPVLAAASARRRMAVSLARQESAFPNPVLTWRGENFGSPLARDAFTTIAQPLDLTGRRLALRAGVRDVDRSALADSTTAMREVEAAAARAFWRASLASALLALAEDQRLDAERLARVEADRAREGAVAEVVAIRTSVEHERARVAEASARATWTHAAAELAQAIGARPESLPPVEPLTAELPRADALPSHDVAVPYALGHRSEITALRATEDAVNRRLPAERRGTLSDVVVEAGTKQTAGYATRVIGVAVPLPLFNRNSAARDRAAADLDLVRAERHAMEQTVRATVTAALDGYRALLSAQPTGADSLVARAEEVARIADAAYAAGGGSLLELLDARRARTETLTAVLRWVADVRIAHLDLLRALGASPLDSLTLP